MAQSNKAQVQKYGPVARQLDSLTEKIATGQRATSNRKKLIELCSKAETQDLLSQMVVDKYAYVRLFAGAVIFDLWDAWLHIPYKHGHDEEYDNRVNEYLSSLSWTVPLLLGLLEDGRVGPAVCAADVAGFMYKADESVRVRYREALLQAGRRESPRLKLVVVQNLSGLYPDDDEALHTLDEEALCFYLESTRHQSEDIRNWSCFELWLQVRNLDERAEAAFRERFEAEDPDSDVFVEAVIGLMRMTMDEDVVQVVIEALGRDDFGKGWVDAVEQSRNPDCLIALIEAYERIIKKRPKADVSDIEYVFIDWNELVDSTWPEIKA
jgi:hypothetical protein